MDNLVFGAVKPLASQTTAQSTLSYMCKNDSPTQTYSARVCFNIGAPAGQFYPRYLWNGSNVLKMQLYKDPSHTLVWGSKVAGPSRDPPLIVELTLAPGESKSGTATL